MKTMQLSFRFCSKTVLLACCIPVLLWTGMSSSSCASFASAFRYGHDVVVKRGRQFHQDNRRIKGTTTRSRSKGKGCQRISLTHVNQEADAAFVEFENATSWIGLPFYDSNTGVQLGIYSDFNADFACGECVGTGTFSFGLGDFYHDQITVSYTCYGASNSIIGGTGMYGCATGYVVVDSYDKSVFRISLYLCGKLCPS